MNHHEVDWRSFSPLSSVREPTALEQRWERVPGVESEYQAMVEGKYGANMCISVATTKPTGQLRC
jgi:hypothetical protein